MVRSLGAHCRSAEQPCGLTDSTTTSTAKNTSGAQVGDHATATTSLITSRRTAAAIAPPMLPIPPRITIASSREIRSYPLLGLKAVVAPNTMPPIAVTATPMPTEIVLVRLTLTPIRSAAVRFCSEARTARPNFVR